MSLLLSQLELSQSKEAPAHRLYDGIRSEIGRLDRLVSDILDYSKPVQLRYEEIDLNDLIHELIKFYRPTTNATGVDLVYNEPKGKFLTKGDRDKIKQSLINIIQNAFDAIAGHGKVELKLDKDREGRTLLVVSDSGSGIPEEMKPRLFDLFFSTKEKGTGFGLSTVRKILDAHGAEIEVESLPGHGTQVYILFAT